MYEKCNTVYICSTGKSKAKIVKFNVNLLLIKRDGFFRAYMNNCTPYTEHAREE